MAAKIITIWRSLDSKEKNGCVHFWNYPTESRTAIHSEDCLRNPKELSECLYDWLNMERDKRSVVAIDGKTIRGSGNTEHKAYHVVSAFVAENQITLGEIVVDEKSNEITAVPELLDIIDVEGAIVTADAMSCQKDITKKITERKADYVLGLKDNQPQLKKDVSDYFFSAIQAPDIYGTPISTETLEKGHGRIEKREYFLITDTDWLDQKDEWSALNGIGIVRTEVDIIDIPINT